MQCPTCQTSNPAGQKFCGTCGHKLETACSQCRAINPTHFKFCGQCGVGLEAVGAITLARSGLITQINQKALDLLGCQQSDMQGKPFSLFVERTDLVIFFSHLNELLSSAKRQSFEITLTHKKQHSIYVLLECSADPHPSKTLETIHMDLKEVTEGRLAAAQMQTQQELLGLLFSVSNNISSVSKKHLAHSIEDALKKICLFAKADLSFIYGINRALNCLDPIFEWRQPSALPLGDNAKLESVPLAKIKNTIIKLRLEKMIVAHDVTQLAPPERDEMRAWYHADLGAVICHLIYSGKNPIGIIGVAKKNVHDEWAPDCITLVHFLGNLIAERLPLTSKHPKATVKPDAPLARETETPEKPLPTDDLVPINDSGDSCAGIMEKSKQLPSEPADRSALQNRPIAHYTSRPMRLEKFSGNELTDRQPVFPRDDGLVLLTCPSCGTQESVSIGRCEKLGNTLRVSCSCSHQFTAILEKRHFFRKLVKLDGYFSLGGDLGPIATTGSIWGQMVVKDLSKTGLRFVSEKAHLIHPDDLLMVRFNLDNTNRALIHKPARVLSITSHGVGCLFEGADSYDITLGFYFM